MSTVPITPSTSVVLINVDDYAPNDPVVLFGKDAAYGKLITVRDKTGTASATTPIYISTSSEAMFTSDVSGDAFTIDQPFGSATLMYKGENPETFLGEWAIVNTFAYPSATVSATFQEVTVSSITLDSGKFIYDHDGDRILEFYSTLFDLSADIRLNGFDISGAGTIYSDNIETDYISSGIAEINNLTVESTVAEYIDATVISTVDLYAEAFSTIDGEIKDLQASTIWASDLIETERISTVDLYADYSSTNTAEINELTVESTIAEYIDATVISTVDLFAVSFSTIDGEIKDLLASTIWASDLIETDRISTVDLYADYSSTNTAEINELTVESTIAEYIDATVISTIDLFAEEFSTFIAEIKDLDVSTIVAGFLDIDSISTTLLGADFISSFAISTFSLKANRVTVSSLLNVRSSIVTPNFYTSSILLQEANTATYVPIANQHRITVSSGFARLNNQDIYVIPRLISTHNLFLSSINLSTIGMRDIITGTREVIESKNDELYYNNSTIQIAAPFFSTVGYIASTINTSTISTGSLFGHVVSTMSNITQNLAVGKLTPIEGFIMDVSGNAFIRTLYISSLFASTQSVTGTNLGRLAINSNAPQNTPLYYHLDVNGNAHVASNFYTSSINTSSIHVSTHLYANTISTNSNLFVGGNSLLSGWTSTNTLYASNISVASLLITPSISTNTMNISSIFGSTVILSNALMAPFISTTSISTASILGSTATLTNALTVPFISTANISTNNVYANNVSTNSISTNSVIGSTIVLINSLTAPWISTINISTTNVYASNISTTSLSTNTLFARQISTPFLQTRDLSASNLAFLNNIQASTITVSSINALSTVTNTLTAFTTMGTISTFTSTIHASNILNVGAGLLRANRLIDAVEMGFPTSRIEISGNNIRQNATSSIILATQNIKFVQANNTSNFEMFEGTTSTNTKNAVLTISRPTGASAAGRFYTEYVQAPSGVKVGQGFIGGTNIFALQYGANTNTTSGIYMNSPGGVGINNRDSLDAGTTLGARFVVNGTTIMSNSAIPLRILGPTSTDTNNSSTIIEFRRIPGEPTNPQSAFIGHSNIATDEFTIQTTQDGGNISLGTKNNANSIFISTNQRVGIFTNNPQYNLHVNGSMFASTISTVNLFTSSIRLTADTSGNTATQYQGMYLSSGRLMLDNRALAFTTDTQSNTGGIASIPLNLSVNTIVVSSLTTSTLNTSTLIANGLTTLINQPKLNLWIAVGGNSPYIKYTGDGSNWSNATTPYSAEVNAVIYDGSRFIAGGNTITTSTDGITWTNITSPPTFTTCFALATDGRTYLAGCSGTNKILRSANGTTWSGVTTSVFGTSCLGLATNGRIWAAVGQGTNTLALSTDNGSNWNGRGTSIFSTAGRCIAYNGTMWVAGGEGTNTLAYSYDASNWTAVSESTSVFSVAARGVAWNGSMWVAVGDDTNTIAYSFDGISWIGVGKTSFTNNGRSIAWNGQQWIAGGNGTNTFSRSSNGITWTTDSGIGANAASVLGLAYSSNITPDLQMSNFGIYSQGIPNYTVSTNQLLITSTTTVLNNSLFINNAANTVGINILPVNNIALDVNGNLRNSGQALLSSISTNLVSSMFLNTSNLTTFIENSRILNTSSIFASTILTSSINTSTINVSTIVNTQMFASTISTNMLTASMISTNMLTASTASFVSTNASAQIASHISANYAFISSIAIGTNSNKTPLYISTSTASSIVIDSVATQGQFVVTSNAIKLGASRSANGNVFIDLVGDTTNTDYGLRLQRNQTSSVITSIGSADFVLGTINSGSATSIRMTNNNYESFTFSSPGKLGINNATPQNTGIHMVGLVNSLTINNNSNSDGQGLNVAFTTYSNSYFSGVSSGDSVIRAATGNLHLGNGSGQPAMTMSNTNVGIGNLNPTIKFDVSGAGRMNSLSTSIISTSIINTSTINTNTISTTRVFTSSINTNYISSQLAEISTLSTVLIYTSTIATMLMSTARFEAGELAFNTGSFTNLAVSGSGTINNTWSSNILVAGGSGGTTLSYSTDNGSNWSAPTSGGTSINTLVNNILWNGSLFIASGDSATTTKIQTSPNGNNWTAITTSILTTSVYGIAFNGTRYVAVGAGGGTIATTTTAPTSGSDTWTGWSTNSSIGTGYGVAWNGSLWVVVGASGGASSIVYSTNGTSWTNATDIFSSGTDPRGRKVAWNGIYWIAVGEGTNTVARSSDGITWTNVSPSGFTAGYDVAWNGIMWVIVGTGTGNTIMYSYDGNNWTAVSSSPFSTSGTGVTWTGRQWVATGRGTNYYATSLDGITWTGRGTSVLSAGQSVGFTALLTSDLILPNLNIYSRNTPNYQLSTNQILVQESSITLNHTLTVNKNSDFVGIRNGNPTIELDVVGGGRMTSLSTTTISTNTVTAAIGTASAPSYTFAGDTNTGIYRPSADQLAVTTGGTQRMMVNSSGYVGIATDSPLAMIDILGGSDNNGGNGSNIMAIQYRTGGYRHFIKTRHINVTNDPGNGIDFYLNDTFSSGGSSTPGTGNVLGLSITSPGVGIGTTSPSQKLDVRGSVYISGNLGIGVTSPGQTLDVNGVARMNAISTPILTVSSILGSTISLSNSVTAPWVSTTNISTNNVFANNISTVNLTVSSIVGSTIAGTLGTASIPSYTFVGDTNTGLFSPGADQLAVTTGGTQRMVFDANGRVGIATSVNTNYRLTIASGGSAGSIALDGTTNAVIDNARIRGVDGSTGGPTFAFANDENTGMYSAGADSLGFVTGGTQRMVINSSGNVGIGTNAASGYKFEVVGTMGINGMIESYATGDGVIKMANNTTLQAKNSSGTYQNVFWPRASDNVTYLNYGTSGFNIRNNSATTTMFMTNDNKVGINTSGPGYNLDVNGTIMARTAMYVGGTAGQDGAQIYMSGGPGDADYAYTVIESRLYGGTEKTELLLFKGNDHNDVTAGPDRIRLRGGQICFDTYPTYTSSRTDENIRMVVDSTGSVGIGTTAPLANTVLDILGGSRNSGLDGSNIFAFQYYSGGGYRHFIKTRHDGTAGNGNGIDFYVNNSGTAGGSSTAGTGNVLRMSIAGNGVGIGTTNPGATLAVNGTVRFTQYATATSDTNIGLNVENSSGGHSLRFHTNMSAGAYNSITQANDKGIIFTNGGSDTGNLVIAPWANATSGIRITSAGNVGIGTTNPGQALDVNGKVNIQNSATNRLIFSTDVNDNKISLWGGDTTTGFYGFGIANNTLRYNVFNSGANHVFYQGNSTELMRIQGDGKVGIGTTNPGTALQVNGTTTTSVSVTAGTKFTTVSTDPTNGPTLFWSSGDGLRFAYATNTAGSGYAELLRITAAGNVGIGTTNPQTISGDPPKLHLYSYNSSYIMRLQWGSQTWEGYWDIGGYVDNNLAFYSLGSLKGYIEDDVATGTQMNFTGQHRCFVKDQSYDSLSTLIGLIVCADNNDYIDMANGTVRGKDAMTIDESLPIVSLSKKANDKKCFGVISLTEDPNNRVFNSGSWTTPYTKEKGDTRAFINSIGEGSLWVSDYNGSIESGDYITTSMIPGYGMKQNDDLLHNYTVAKVTIDCDFTNPKRPKYIIKKDASGNNILDSLGNITWIQEIKNGNPVFEDSYNLRYIKGDGTIITKSQYDILKQQNVPVYRAAFLGCTYHCG